MSRPQDSVAAHDRPTLESTHSGSKIKAWVPSVAETGSEIGSCNKESTKTDTCNPLPTVNNLASASSKISIPHKPLQSSLSDAKSESPKSPSQGSEANSDELEGKLQHGDPEAEESQPQVTLMDAMEKDLLLSGLGLAVLRLQSCMGTSNLSASGIHACELVARNGGHTKQVLSSPATHLSMCLELSPMTLNS